MSTYLRRYRLEPRRRTGRILAVALVFMALLFGKVWQSISANSLSIERDRLRREVRALENRIRLSSELRVQAALREGLDHNALQALGFRNPDPAEVVPIDLNQPLPRAKGARDGVVARFGSLLKGFGGGSDRERADDDASALPVSAEIAR